MGEDWVRGKSHSRVFSTTRSRLQSIKLLRKAGGLTVYHTLIYYFLFLENNSLIAYFKQALLTYERAFSAPLNDKNFRLNLHIVYYFNGTPIMSYQTDNAYIPPTLGTPPFEFEGRWCPVGLTEL